MALVWKYAEVTGMVCVLVTDAACKTQVEFHSNRVSSVKAGIPVGQGLPCVFTAGNSKWKGLTWGMMPLLGGALCACTYHFYYNSSDLDFLVAVQASLTWIGNATCAAAAYRIYKSSEQEGAA